MQLFSICLVHKTFYMFQAVSSPIIRSTKLYIQRQVFVRPMLLPAAVVEEMEVPDVVYTYLCSWWWVEEPPETCRASCEQTKLRKVASRWL